VDTSLDTSLDTSDGYEYGYGYLIQVWVRVSYTSMGTAF